MVRRATDFDVACHGHHVMKCRDSPAGAGERRRIPGMSVHDGTDIRPGTEQVPVKAPFTRGTPLPKPTAVEVQQRNLRRGELFVDRAGRTDEAAALIPTDADIPRRSIGEPPTRQLAA